MLFGFFDLIYELKDVGAEGYRLYAALTFVALSIPGHLYELLPVAALIGTLLAPAQLVIHSEYAVMAHLRCVDFEHGGDTVADRVVFAVATFVTGNSLPPYPRGGSEAPLEADQQRGGASVPLGLWVKDDELRERRAGAV